MNRIYQTGMNLVNFRNRIQKIFSFLNSLFNYTKRNVKKSYDIHICADWFCYLWSSNQKERFEDRYKKKEREKERKWNHQVRVVIKETMNPFIVTTIQSWHGSWRHLLRFGNWWPYDKAGAENFTTVTINKSIIKSFSGFRDWIYR